MNTNKESIVLMDTSYREHLDRSFDNGYAQLQTLTVGHGYVI